MRRFIWATSYIAGGIAAGCFSAFVMIQQAGVKPVAAGTPWLSRAAAMAESNAYYVRSHYLLEGRLPPAPGQLSEATADTDSEGHPLTGNCSYKITSTAPLPRWWSIAIIAGSSANAELQATADSDTIVRDADGVVRITAAQDPAPGNWLKTPDRRSFTMLYSSLASGPKPGLPPFTITQAGCL
ncbi:DUF1214 domain-containing protein [Aestuariivirga sp.]|uniref:DUF1214 domain-containing protein n=1 Tax=Aestuariivirga sp. TaxID=2650926 RepID=UPI003BAB93BF